MCMMSLNGVKRQYTVQMHRIGYVVEASEMELMWPPGSQLTVPPSEKNYNENGSEMDGFHLFHMICSASASFLNEQLYSEAESVKGHHLVLMDLCFQNIELYFLDL